MSNDICEDACVGENDYYCPLPNCIFRTPPLTREEARKEI